MAAGALRVARLRASATLTAHANIATSPASAARPSAPAAPRNATLSYLWRAAHAFHLRLVALVVSLFVLFVASIFAASEFGGENVVLETHDGAGLK